MKYGVRCNGSFEGENSDLRLIEYRTANLPDADRQAFGAVGIDPVFKSQVAGAGSCREAR